MKANNNEDFALLPLNFPVWRERFDWAVRLWKRNVPPFTLKAHRLGIQWTLVMLLFSPTTYIRRLPAMTRSSANYLAIYALLVWDPTCGGALKKSMDRFISIIISIAMSLPFWYPVWLAGYRSLKQNGWMWWAFYASTIVSAFAWNFIRYHYPSHRILYCSGLTSSLYGYSMTYDNWLRSIIEGDIAKILGVVGGTLVFHYILRVPARDKLLDELGSCAQQLSLVLEPLMALDSGCLSSHSFLQENHSPLEIVAQRAFDQQRAQGSMQRKGSLRRRLSKRNSTVEEMEPLDVDYDIFHAFKENIWEQVNAVHVKLQGQPLLLRGAVMEVIHTKPRKFPKALYQDLSSNVQRLFFHIAAIYSILETQEAVLRVDSRSFIEAAGEQWAWARIATTATRLINFGHSSDHIALRLPPRPMSVADFISSEKRSSQSRPDSLADLTAEHLLTTMGALQPPASGKAVGDSAHAPAFYRRIAVGPIVKWGNQFAPLIGRMSRFLSAAVKALGDSLEQRIILDALSENIESSFAVLSELEIARKRSSRTAKKVVDQMLLDGNSSEAKKILDVELLQEILALTAEEYDALNGPARALLWSAYGNMQDRLVHTIAMLTSIAAQLKTCSNSLHTFFVAMHYHDRTTMRVL